MRTLPTKLLFVLALTALGIGAAMYYEVLPWRGLWAKETQPPRSSPSPAPPVKELGWIQPRGGVVEVAVPAGFRLMRFAEGTALGATVEKDAVLAYLDGYDERQKEVEVIDVQITEAEAILRTEADDERSTLESIEAERQRAQKLGELQIEALRKRIDLLEESCAFSADQLRAVEGLQTDNTIPRQDYEKLQAALKRDQGELACARAELQRAQAQLASDTGDEKIDEQKRKTRLAAERARREVALEPLKRKRELALAVRERTLVRAPIAGRVLEITTKPGEAGVTAPLLRLGDTSQMYVQAEVYEDERWKVRSGQTATITGRGLPGSRPLRGQVERIGLIASGRKLMPLDPAAEADSHVFQVWIKLDPQGSKEVQDYSLLRVDVAIDVSGGGRGRAPVRG